MEFRIQSNPLSMQSMLLIVSGLIDLLAPAIFLAAIAWGIHITKRFKRIEMALKGAPGSDAPVLTEKP